jgi:hypothetical protein
VIRHVGSSLLTGVLEFWSSGVLGFWGSGVLGFWGSGVLGFWGSGVLGFWGSGVLGFWGSGDSLLIYGLSKLSPRIYPTSFLRHNTTCCHVYLAGKLATHS